MINDEYVKAINDAYWEEETEYKMGVHPTQIIERMEEISQCKLPKDTYLNYIDNDKVELISPNKEHFATFNYRENKFIFGEIKNEDLFNECFLEDR